MEKKLSLEAKIENLDTVTGFVESELEVIGCTMKQITQINLAVEEIFVNIAHYAYGQLGPEGTIIKDTGAGPVDIVLDSDNSRVVLTFVDKGIKFDPLSKEDPDTTLPVEDRGIGGLGIFMVKKIMDEVQYRYENGKNILTIRKNL